MGFALAAVHPEPGPPRQAKAEPGRSGASADGAEAVQYVVPLFKSAMDTYEYIGFG